MPLPTKSSAKSKSDCISKAIQIEVRAGKEPDQAKAIAYSHCDKIFEKDINEIEDAMYSIFAELEHLRYMNEVLEKEKEKVS